MSNAYKRFVVLIDAVTFKYYVWDRILQIRKSACYNFYGIAQDIADELNKVENG